MQLLLRSKAETVHGVCPAVCPLAELLGRLGECHAGRDGAVDDRLNKENPFEITQTLVWLKLICLPPQLLS